MSIITVIGSGVMGSAMSFPARANGHMVRLVGTMLDRDIINHVRISGFHLTLDRTLPDGVEYYHLEELDKALIDVDLIISGVSSFGVEWFADEIIPRLPKDIPVLSVTKGMILNTDGSLTSYPAYYASKFPLGDFCAVGGPCTSYELADLDHSHVGFCGRNMDSLKNIKDFLATEYYHISLTTDVEGLEFAVAIKNVYALAVSLAVGLSLKRDDTLHYNSQAAIFTQSVREMRRLLFLFGHDDENIIFGAGDLYVTVYGGRTRKLGTLLGMGKDFQAAMQELDGVTLESVVIATRVSNALLTLIDKEKASRKDFPLLLHVYDIISKDITVDVPWKDFG